MQESDAEHLPGEASAEEDEVRSAVASCLLTLCRADRDLLINDVSERAITHKLAEYLQACFPDRNVDVEYNRNSGGGLGTSKWLQLLVQKKREVTALVSNRYEDDRGEEILLETSTYPDIVIHRRLSNDHNLLVIEVKKRNSPIDQEYDRAKLKAFTHPDTNPYRYKFGLSILLTTGAGYLHPPKLEWYKGGRRAT